MSNLTMAILLSLCVGTGATWADVCSDLYEPDDDVWATTALIRDGEVQHRNFCEDTGDWVGFPACAGHTYVIETSDLGDQADTLLELYSADGTTMLAHDDDGAGYLASRIVWTATSTATFHIKVRQADNTYGPNRTYDLHLYGETSACDLWVYTLGGAPWDEAVGVVQRGTGEILYLSKTESSSHSTDFLYNEIWPDGLLSTRAAGGYTVEDVPHTVVADGHGGSFAVGETRNAPAIELDTIIEKMGPSGSVLLRDIALLAGDQHAYSVSRLGEDIIVGGSTAEPVGSDLDALISWKYGSTYGGRWTFSMGGDGDEEFYSVVTTTTKHIFAAGWTNSFGAGDKDGLVVRLDEAGAIVWANAYGTAGADEIRRVLIGDDGGLVLVGSSASTAWAAPSDIWLTKIDEDGRVLWSETVGGSGDDRSYGAAIQRDGTIVIAGSTDTAAPGNADALIVGLDTGGALKWVRTYGGASSDRFNDVIALADDALALAGYTKSFGSLTADAWVMKTASNGLATMLPCAGSATASFFVRPASTTATLVAIATVSVTPNYQNPYYWEDHGGFGPSRLCSLREPLEVSRPGSSTPLRFPSWDQLTWEDRAANNAELFNLYRGSLGGPGLDQSCAQAGLAENHATDTGIPDAGAGWSYLVTAKNALGEGTLGADSAAEERVNAAPCP